jgi:hypothetical protein
MKKIVYLLVQFFYKILMLLVLKVVGIKKSFGQKKKKTE